MQQDFATIVVRRDTPQAGAVKNTKWRYETDWKWKDSENEVTFTQDYNRKRGPNHGSEKWTKGQSFQRGDQNYTNDGHKRTFSTFFGLSLPDKTQHTGTTIRLMEHHMINAKINHSVATMELGLEIDLLTIRMETGKKLKVFLDLHRLWGEFSQRTINTPNQKMINLTIVPTADLTIHWRVVSYLTNRKFHKTITKCHTIRSVLIQPTTPILNHQTFARYTTKVCEHELR